MCEHQTRVAFDSPCKTGLCAGEIALTVMCITQVKMGRGGRRPKCDFLAEGEGGVIVTTQSQIRVAQCRPNVGPIRAEFGGFLKVGETVLRPPELVQEQTGASVRFRVIGI